MRFTVCSPSSVGRRQLNFIFFPHVLTAFSKEASVTRADTAKWCDQLRQALRDALHIPMASGQFVILLCSTVHTANFPPDQRHLHQQIPNYLSLKYDLL